MLRIKALQIALTWHSPAANRQYIESLLAKMPDEKFDVLVLPEMFTSGFTMQPEDIAEPMYGETTIWMREIANRYDCLVMGSFVVEDAGHYFNRLLAVSAEKVEAYYDKRHLFRMANEHEHYACGETPVVFTWRNWRIRPLICYDLRFPVWSRNTADDHYMPLAYDILVYVANWPSRRIAHWDALLRARAIENQAYVIGVNRIGRDANDHEYTGNSLILSPQGEVLAEAEDHTEAILSATLLSEEMRTYRQRFPAWMDADTFAL